MAVKIRLARAGRTHLPFYRIVAADSRYARDGRYIEQVGTYDPKKGVKDGSSINSEVALKWLRNGAQPSDTVKAIFKANGVYEALKETKKGE